eukprot:1583044-Pyramimonas_sp.AAC.1
MPGTASPTAGSTNPLHAPAAKPRQRSRDDSRNKRLIYQTSSGRCACGVHPCRYYWHRRTAKNERSNVERRALAPRNREYAVVA